MSLEEQIKKSRKIAKTSLKQYMSSLKALRKRMDPDVTGPIESTEFLNDIDIVLESIDEYKTITTKKNILTAVLVALGSDSPKKEELIEKISETLHNYNKKYIKFLKTQKKTETQLKNWIEYEELVEIINNIGREVKAMKIHKKKKLTKREFDLLQQYVILMTYMNFPLRNDFADMEVETLADYKKIPDDEKEHTNYLVLSSNNVKHFHINDFKNKRLIGKKVMKVPKSLNKIINIWLKYNKSGYYLVRISDREFPMRPNDITRYLNKIFKDRADGKRISTSMIRHIIISYELRDEPTIEEKELSDKKIEDRFFHSRDINSLYRKVD